MRELKLIQVIFSLVRSFERHTENGTYVLDCEPYLLIGSDLTSECKQLFISKFVDSRNVKPLVQIQFNNETGEIIE